MHKHPTSAAAAAAMSGLAALLLTQLEASAQGAQPVYAPSQGEYTRSISARQLSLSGVHSLGILGRGVIVGVLDTGMNVNHPEFRHSGRVLTGYNASNGGSDVSDTWGHGTHVAGIIAASADGVGMHGVAPGATLLPVKVFADAFGTGVAGSAEMDRGLLHAASRGARVINMSLGGSAPTGNAALTRITSGNQTLVVVAAGNDGLSNPAWPARYAKEGWANGSMIAVGAVDANRRIASFSNRAGDAASFYLVAPGVHVSATFGEGYASLSGTSMAAPAVSGAAALLMGYWPYLKANQVAAILLNTADDLGAKGTDPIYGRGLLNVQRALSPQGSHSYRNAVGTVAVLPLTGKAILSSQPRVTTPTAFGGLVTQVFDDYGRNFTSDEGAALSATTQITADSLMGRSDRMLEAAERTLPGGARLLTWQSRQGDVQAPLPGLSHTSRTDAWNRLPGDTPAAMFHLRTPQGHGLSAGDGGLASLALGLSSELKGPLAGSQLSGMGTLLANPLLGFAPDHRFVALGLPLGQGWRSTFSLIRTQPKALEDDHARANLNVIELMHQGENHALNLSLGSMNEQGLLGGYSNSAVGLSQTTGTHGLTVSGAIKLAQAWRLAGSYSAAYTAAPVANGLLLSATGIRSKGFGLGLVRADTWREGDRLSFMLNAPLRASAGTLNYQVIDSINPEDGSPHYATHTVQLRPKQREWVLEARYFASLSERGTLSAAAALRQHPDHDDTAPSQVALGLRYQLSF
jgi:Subtilase family